MQYLAELLQGGDVLQNYFGQCTLHEVGIHGVCRQHCLVSVHTGAHGPVQLHQRPTAQALQANRSTLGATVFDMAC